MNFIDEKGRLFGKINIIDFLVLVLLLGLLPIIYYGHKLTVRPPLKITQEIKPEPKYSNVELNCRLIGIEPGTVPQIAVGDSEVDAKGAKIGEILWLGEAGPYQHNCDVGLNGNFVAEDDELREIPARMSIKVRLESDSIFYKDKRITVSSPISFKSDKYAIEAVPVFLGGQVNKNKPAVVQNFPVKKNIYHIEVKFSGIAPELANELTEGDTEKDSENKTAAKLEKIISRENSQGVVYVPEERNFILVANPFMFDIKAVFKMTCLKQNGTWYFKNCPIRIGDPITFDMDRYSITGTIIGIDMK